MKLLFFILVLLPFTVHAGTYSYSCKVKAEYVLSDSGELDLKNNLYFGSEFNVERKSGVVLGDGVGNSSYPTKQIIDIGSEEQSYKLIWISSEVIGVSGAFNAVYLNVEEYNENLLKPYTLVLGTRTLTGTCK
jgi:hypothetical protein